MHPLILGVFAFLDALPEDLLPPVTWLDSSSRDKPEDKQRKKLAKFLNGAFRLQSWECPLRPLLAGYGLHFRDDMADALAAAYMLHKDGKDPEEALTADYCPGYEGLLCICDLDEYRKAKAGSLNADIWREFSGFYKDGDRLVKYRRYTSLGYLLFRGDRLVWKYKAFRYTVIGASLRRNTDQEKFIALGNTKGFLNGDFIWPPADWINPVTDEQEEAYFKESRVRMLPRSSLHSPDNQLPSHSKGEE
jgi:hypothetical protein